jgi:hypothetical protein
VTCTYAGCGVVKPRQRLAEHAQQCPQRPMSCRGRLFGCRWQGAHRSLADHEGACFLVAALPHLTQFQRLAPSTRDRIGSAVTPALRAASQQHAAAMQQATAERNAAVAQLRAQHAGCAGQLATLRETVVTLRREREEYQTQASLLQEDLLTGQVVAAEADSLRDRVGELQRELAILRAALTPRQLAAIAADGRRAADRGGADAAAGRRRSASPRRRVA